jgi:hypothetical protein
VDYTVKSPGFEFWDKARKVRYSAWYGVIQNGIARNIRISKLPSESCTE